MFSSMPILHRGLWFVQLSTKVCGLHSVFLPRCPETSLAFTEWMSPPCPGWGSNDWCIRTYKQKVGVGWVGLEWTADSCRTSFRTAGVCTGLESGYWWTICRNQFQQSYYDMTTKVASDLQQNICFSLGLLAFEVLFYSGISNFWLGTFHHFHCSQLLCRFGATSHLKKMPSKQNFTNDTFTTVHFE